MHSSQENLRLQKLAEEEARRLAEQQQADAEAAAEAAREAARQSSILDERQLAVLNFLTHSQAQSQAALAAKEKEEEEAKEKDEEGKVEEDVTIGGLHLPTIHRLKQEGGVKLISEARTPLEAAVLAELSVVASFPEKSRADMKKAIEDVARAYAEEENEEEGDKGSGGAGGGEGNKGGGEGNKHGAASSGSESGRGRNRVEEGKRGVY